MANEQNLHRNRSPSEARENGRKGGVASGVVRRKKRSMKNAAKMLLDLGVSSDKNTDILKSFGVEEDDLTNQVAILVAMINKAVKGDVKAATFLRDTIGESPAQRIHESEMKLRRDEFEYKKKKSGTDEIAVLEKLDEVLERIEGVDNAVQ